MLNGKISLMQSILYKLAYFTSPVAICEYYELTSVCMNMHTCMCVYTMLNSLSFS